MKASTKELIAIMLLIAICVTFAVALLLWITQNVDPTLGGWLR